LAHQIGIRAGLSLTLILGLPLIAVGLGRRAIVIGVDVRIIVTNIVSVCVAVSIPVIHVRLIGGVSVRRTLAGSISLAAVVARVTRGISVSTTLTRRNTMPLLVMRGDRSRHKYNAQEGHSRDQSFHHLLLLAKMLC
jgi:hypothetical protein